MHLDQITTDRLVKLFKTITPEMAARLIQAIEQGQEQNGPDPVLGQILPLARSVLRKTGNKTVRKPSAQRKFVEPFSAMLTALGPSSKQKGRISRSSIVPIWKWLNGTVLHGTLPQLSESLEKALAGSDETLVRQQQKQFYAAIFTALHEIISRIDRDEKEYGRLSISLGGTIVVEDMREIATALSFENEIRELSHRLPHRIPELDEDTLDVFAGLFRSFREKIPGAPHIVMAILMSRLKHRAQILRMSIKCLGTDRADIFAQSEYGVAGDLLLFDLDSCTEETARLLVHHAPAQKILESVGLFHDIAKGLSTELDLDSHQEWKNRLSEARKHISVILNRDLATVPRMIKKCLWGQPVGVLSDRKNRHGSELQKMGDEQLENAVRAMHLLTGISIMADQLSLKAQVGRIKKDVDAFLGSISDKVIHDIQVNTGEMRDRALDYLDATITLVEMAHGEEMADLLRRRGNVALQDQKKAG